MNIGYHYHVPYKLINNKVYLPSYFGLFIDELAKNSTKLYLFLFEQTDTRSTIEDYELQEKNIELVSLGKFPTFYHRLLYPFSFLSICKKYGSVLDHFIVRAPTPLSAYLFWTMKSESKVTLMIVGDYIKSLGGLEQPLYRKIPIIILTYFYQYLHLLTIRRANVVVNSPELFDYLKSYNPAVKLIKTTTLSKKSFFDKKDTCQSAVIKLLYTGRINYSKGLAELVEALSILNQAPTNHTIELHVVGWEDKNKVSITDQLKEKARQLGVENHLFFHGKKKIGDELNQFYRDADIYVIPSYHEGFPRTIWEALSQSTPVVATEVGGIPYYLTHQQHAYLIEPKSTMAIVNAIKEVMSNSALRAQLIKNGMTLAREVTLEYQTQKLVETLHD